MAFAGAMMGNPASVGAGIAAAMEAGIKIAELMEEIVVSFCHHLPYQTKAQLNNLLFFHLD
jgi:hypothetical protein